MQEINGNVYVTYAPLLAPFAYVQLVWISILGILVFGAIPDAVTVIGMAIVVAGGLLVASLAPNRGEIGGSARKTHITLA